MAISHAASGELINVLPLGVKLPQSSSSTLVRANHLEVLRLVLAADMIAVRPSVFQFARLRQYQCIHNPVTRAALV